MITPALMTFGLSVGLWIVLAVTVNLEKRRGKRFILKRFRRWLDYAILEVNRQAKEGWNNFARYVVQLGWYYSLHSLLRAFLKVLHTIYEYIEALFENNRKKAKLLRAEMRNKYTDTHLNQVAEHKAKVALTPEEQVKLRHEKLEDTH